MSEESAAHVLSPAQAGARLEARVRERLYLATPRPEGAFPIHRRYAGSEEHSEQGRAQLAGRLA